ARLVSLAYRVLALPVITCRGELPPLAVGLSQLPRRTGAARAGRTHLGVTPARRPRLQPSSRLRTTQDGRPQANRVRQGEREPRCRSSSLPESRDACRAGEAPQPGRGAPNRG